MQRRLRCLTIMAVLMGAASIGTGNQLVDLPVKQPTGRLQSKGVRNAISLSQIRNVVGPSRDGKGLLLDLQDETLFGSIYAGPYPFEQDESEFDYMRFRVKTSLTKGKGVIHCHDFVYEDKVNANSWPRPTMTVAYRLELYRRRGTRFDVLGFHDNLVSFTITETDRRKPVFRKTITVIEGPFVSLLTSDEPGTALLVWQTDVPCRTMVSVHARDTSRVMSYRDLECTQTPAPDRSSVQHEVKLHHLRPDSSYAYTIQCRTAEGQKTSVGPYQFNTAPEPGQGKAVFAFVSDSREGVGGGERAMMGHNAHTLRQIARDAYQRGAQFFLFGGDLVNGYTTDTDDFRLQMRAWKQSLAGFWRTRPVYPVMGNHEALLKVFGEIRMDKWPYTTDSAEAVFAEQFWNPRNGPETSDARRPTYKENVYSFQYGPVLSLGYNNNYWWSSNEECRHVGGSPEGYLMTDQLAWIEQRLKKAEADPSIKYIVMYAQEPVFPCGGHVKDCMWWNGDNTLRAWTYRGKSLVAKRLGMIDVRNRFWAAIARSSKVAVVLSGDEHEYHRLRVDKNTPVGVVAQDDLNRNNKLDDGRISPNPAFVHPTWHVTAGTAGAPYYAREETPWTPTVLSSQAGYCLFQATAEKISLTFYAMTGQVIDHVDDLMAIKQN
jgi:hypothetical protein